MLNRNFRSGKPVLKVGSATMGAVLFFGLSNAPAQTLSISNDTSNFGSYGAVSSVSGTTALKFDINNAGPAASGAAWCAIDTIHGGSTVSSGTVTSISVGGSAAVTTGALPIGYYDLFVAPTGGCQGTNYVQASLSVILNNTSSADSRFGINMLAGVNAHAKYIGFVANVATAMQAVGFGGSRDQLYWKTLEQTAGTYGWPSGQPSPPCTASMLAVVGFVCVFNNSYNSFANNLLTLAFGNTVDGMSTNTTPPSTSAQITAYDNYAAAIVAPLSGSPGKINPAYIDALGVWNEFSNDQFCSGCSATISTRGSAYASILTTVRSSAGGKTLVGGAATSMGLPWWVLGQPVSPASAVDALDIHPYSLVADTLRSDLANYATYVNGSGGLGGKAIWATEYGPESMPSSYASYESYLAGYPAKSAAIMLRNGVTDIFWYAAADTNNTGTTLSSLLFADANFNNYFPSPAFVGFNTVIRTLSGYTPDLSYDQMAGTSDERVHAYHFTSGSKDAYVIWMSSGSATVSFSSGSPTGVDAVGTAISLPATLSNDLPILITGTSLAKPTITPSDVFLASSVDDFALDICSGAICAVGGSEPGPSSLSNWQYGTYSSGTLSTSSMQWTASFEDYSWMVSGGAGVTRAGQSPGTNPVARAWVAPAAESNVVINGFFVDESSSGATGTAVAIFKNGSMIWPSSGSWMSLGVGGSATFAGVSAGSLSSGDKIIFATKYLGSSVNNDHGGVVAYISKSSS